MQRFYLPEFRTSCSIIKLDFESPSLKNIAFEKKCSNIKLANMALSKQQLASKLAKKNLSLDEKVKFLDLPRETPMLGCRKLAEIFKIRKTAASNIIKEENIRRQHEYFMKNLRNEIVLASIEELMRSYTSDTRDVVLLTFIKMDQ